MDKRDIIAKLREVADALEDGGAEPTSIDLTLHEGALNETVSVSIQYRDIAAKASGYSDDKGKVYIVAHGAYEEWGIDAVFSTEEKAQSYIDRHIDNWFDKDTIEIKEYEIA